MDKNGYFILWLTVLFLVTPNISLAYNLGMDVSQLGYVRYSFPAILGDYDEFEEEELEDEKVEARETPRVEKPEKIEIKKDENKINIEFKKRNKVEQKLNPENSSLKFSAVPKTTPIHEQEIEDINDDNDGIDEVLEERSQRKNEKVEIQSEVHDDGTVEIQVESRQIKAKIKNSEIELDINNNNIGSSDSEGKKIELVHLPDQALQKFLDLGVSTVSDTLEVGQSGNNFEYTIDATKTQKLFGLIPRETKFKLSLDDSSGNVKQQKVAINLIEQILNFFSY